MFETIFADLAIEAIIWELTELLAVVTLFANFVTIWLPNHSPYPLVQWVLDVLNKLSLNIYKNANRLHDQLEKKRYDEQYDIDEAVQRAIERQRKSNPSSGRRAGGKP